MAMAIVIVKDPLPLDLGRRRGPSSSSWGALRDSLWSLELGERADLTDGPSHEPDGRKKLTAAVRYAQKTDPRTGRRYSLLRGKVPGSWHVLCLSFDAGR